MEIKKFGSGSWNPGIQNQYLGNHSITNPDSDQPSQLITDPTGFGTLVAGE